MTETATQDAPVTQTTEAAVAAAFGKTPPATKEAPAVKATPDATTEKKAAPSVLDVALKAGQKTEKKVEPTVDVSAEAEKALGKDASPAARENFKKLHETKRVIESEYHEYKTKREAEFAKLKADHDAVLGKTKDFDRIQQEHQQFAERLRVLDFQSHPEFVEKYVAPAKDALGSMATALAVSGVVADVNAIATLPLAERRKAANEIIVKLNDHPIEQSEFRDALFRLERVERDRGEALKNHEALRQRFDAEQSARRQKDMEIDSAFIGEVYQDVLGDSIAEMQVPETAEPHEKEAAKAYNESLARMRQEASDIALGKFTNAKDAKRGAAEAAIRAAAGRHIQETVLPILQRAVTETLAKNKELEAELAAIRGKRAKYDPAGGGEDSGGSGKPQTIEQAVAAAFGR